MVKRPFAIHFIFFALWPVVFFYSLNVGLVPFSQAWRSIAVLLGLALGLLIPFAMILRSTERAAAVVSLFFFLFFSYGHVYDTIMSTDQSYTPTEESLVMVVWMALFVGGTSLIVRVKERWSDITRILNVVSLTLVLISLVNVGIYHSKTRASLEVALAQSRNLPEADPGPISELPNIYYVVLDEYGRHDVLEEIYQYDNSEFLDFLERQGFYIATRARANYAQTQLSLASSLNLGYLDQVADAVGPDSDDRRPLTSLLQQNSVIRFLKEHGYTTVALPSGYGPTTLSSSDGYAGSSHAWTELEIGLLCSTPIPALTVHGSLLDPYAAHRRKILDGFDLLVATTDLPSPYFVFAHILAPHGPFVFDEHGNEIEPEGQFQLSEGAENATDDLWATRYRQGYIGQLAFVSDRIASVIGDILSRASGPTIIILQSDHGPRSLIDWEQPTNSCFKERFAILNAYRLPPDDSIGLYDGITPVNTFRLIFNHYFGANLEQLEDLSYFSNWTYPYRFINVTDEVRYGTPPPTSR